jgi:ElaB/YqjD/DUF883 family membrane-anchored ribosome-binding protein
MSVRRDEGQQYGPEWILNTIKRNPEGLLLLAAGAVLMLRTNSAAQGVTRGEAFADRSFEAARNASGGRVSETVDRARDQARGMMDAAQSYAATAAESARQSMDTARSYVSSAADYTAQAGQTIGEQSERISRQTRATVENVVNNQPFAVMAAGVAAGVALAAIFPPTDIEKQTLGPVGEEMSKAAERFGGQLRQATAKAGEKLRSEAEERGLHPEGLKDVAGEVVDTFKSSMSGQSGSDQTANANVAGTSHE